MAEGLSNRLRELRLQRGLTLEEVGLKVGYSHAAVSRQESGVRGLDGTAIDRYATLYKLEPWEIWLTPEEALTIQELRETRKDHAKTEELLATA